MPCSHSIAYLLMLCIDISASESIRHI
uniref:Uncharacterized protein n=1 Tax=Arundo donax TaxID=35708 RepID=A0A0A9GJ56_ARUDO